MSTDKERASREKISQLDRKLKVLSSKISELSQDSKEHGLVLNAFEKVDPERRCFRVIGGVMVERTVKTVKPALEKEKAALDSAISELEKQYESIEEELRTLIENLSKESNMGIPSSTSASSSSSSEVKA
ncbi:Prefoldin subunit family protein [Cryptosporidium meleagridis]|uniref:Prefoldin subunit family protein n=1 Tax=Cryptosporidium meleagridis TaxID=93969 RepID=A0A2P4YXU7_9CRYT|nr:Prefoldin subunit family protein [Cryptosporidium meleagridis]